MLAVIKLKIPVRVFTVVAKSTFDAKFVNVDTSRILSSASRFVVFDVTRFLLLISRLLVLEYTVKNAS